MTGTPYRHCQCGHAQTSHAVACEHQNCVCVRYSRCECRRDALRNLTRWGMENQPDD